MKVKLNLN